MKIDEIEPALLSPISDAERQFLLDVENHPSVVDDPEAVRLLGDAVKAEAVRIAKITLR